MVVAARLRDFESEVGQITIFVDGYGGFYRHALVNDAATFFFHHVRLEVYVVLESDRRVEVAPFYLDRDMHWVQDESLISVAAFFITLGAESHGKFSDRSYLESERHSQIATASKARKRGLQLRKEHSRVA
jgi:hypothetical protein